MRTTNQHEYAKEVIRGTYLPHVDGIRAVAVIPVLLYHLWATMCPGGYSGVDVFFVISGYLIGGGIINDLRKGDFSFCDFYTRRIKRIMPAYFAMILTALIVGLFIYHYEPLKSLGNASLRSSYFFANFFCYKFLGNYFAGDADLHPLINLWSLSVEEQFYIVVPLLMWLLWKLKRRLVLPLLVVLMAFSFLQAELLLNSGSNRDTIKAFYMLVPRAWELFAGVALAFLPRYEAFSERQKHTASSLAILGFILAISAYIFLKADSRFPGTGALASVAGCILMIRYGAFGPIGLFLKNRLTVGIGRISYSLYLWHWPVIAYMHYICGKELTAGQITFAATLSFILAVLSWKYIEMPVRRCKTIGIRTATTGLLVTCLMTGGVGSLLYKTNGLINHIHAEANAYQSLEYPRHLQTMPEGNHGIAQLNGILNDKGHVQNNVIKMLGDKELSPSFILMGDSHAEALQIGLDDICAKHNKAGLAIGIKTSPPLYGIEITNTFGNITMPFLQWIEKHPQIKTVIIACRWHGRLNNNSGNQILYRTGASIPADSSGNNELLISGLQETCIRLKAMGKDIILTGPEPELRLAAGSEIRRRIMLGLDTSDIGDSISLEEYYSFSKPVMDILAKIESEQLARVVPTHQPFIQNGRFYGILNGKLMYHDTNHLSGEGSRHLIENIYDKLFPKTPGSNK